MKRSELIRKTPMKRATPKPATRRIERIATPLCTALRVSSHHGSATAAVKREVVRMEAPIRPQPKDVRYISEQWRRHVAGLPCVHCGGASQAAHRNLGKGLGLKTDDCLCAALCPPEHARIDQGRDLTRDERRAIMDRYIVLTLQALVKAGKVGPI